MFPDDSDRSGEEEGGRNIEPVICLLFQRDSCSRTKDTCDSIHCKYPFLWQSQINGQWQSFPEFHCIELEKAFRIASLDGTEISATDPVTKQQYFDPAQKWWAKFDEMVIQQGDSSFNIRRLSTISSKMSSSSIATEFEWYVQNERNQWIKYGEMNEGNHNDSASSSNLMNLEHYYAFEEVDQVDIPSSDNEYSIDFVQMTETNKTTRVVRKLRRRVKNGPLLAGTGPASDYTDMSVNIGAMVAAVPAAASSYTGAAAAGYPGGVRSAETLPLIYPTASAMAPVTGALPLPTSPSVTATNPAVITAALQHVAAARPAVYAAPVPPHSGVAGRPAADQTAASPAANSPAGARLIYNVTPPPAVSVGTPLNSLMSYGIAALSYSLPAFIVDAVNFLLNYVPGFPGTGLTPALPASSAPYVWQFQDEHGAWIEYGTLNTKKNHSCVTHASSDDIEMEYASNPSGSMYIESHLNRYELDFQNMTQTNLTTGVVRPMQRTRRNPNAVHQTGPSHSAGPATRGAGSFVWQFQDEYGAWITYGEGSTNNYLSCVTSANSDDIESSFAMNPMGSIALQSRNNQYVLDFQSMTQTNFRTGVVRRVRRVGRM